MGYSLFFNNKYKNNSKVKELKIKYERLGDIYAYVLNN